MVSTERPLITAVSDFLGIPVTALRVDCVTDFDLYLPGPRDRVPVLYRRADQPFTEEIRQRLEERRVETLLVSMGQREALDRYIERNIGAIVSNAALPMETRSAALYGAAQTLMREAMTDPRSCNLLERSAGMVEHTVDFLFRESRSFQHLLRVTSYDYYTYTHSVNVFLFSTALAAQLGHDAAEARVFGQGALLHDIGKSRLDHEIVAHQGALSDAQWEEMKKHPVYGWEILREQGVTDPVVLDVTRHHHEKLTGKGYPDGLAGDAISRWTRMCTICDIFDALTTRRSYKEAMNSFPSLQLMKEHMTDELDQDIFRTFVRMMAASEA